jgi:hypothetical protein
MHTKVNDTNRQEKKSEVPYDLDQPRLFSYQSILTMYVGCLKIYLFAFLLMIGIVNETNLTEKTVLLL